MCAARPAGGAMLLCGFLALAGSSGRSSGPGLLGGCGFGVCDVLPSRSRRLCTSCCSCFRGLFF